MKRFKNILVYVDGRDGGRTAVRRALELARKNEAKLTVMDVIPELPPHMKRLESLRSVHDLEQMAEEDARQCIADLLDTMECQDVSVEVEVLIGVPYQTVIRHVLTHGVDLVLKSAEQPHGIQQRLFGTTGLHLLRKCPCPVWIIKPELDQRFERVMVAVNASVDDEEESKLNYDLLELGSAVAERDEADLHVVFAWELWREGFLRASRFIDTESVDGAKREQELENRNLVERLVKNFRPGLAAEIHVPCGEAEHVIPGVVEDQRIDLLVMGTVGRSGLAGMFVGNTAEQILGSVDCSVLALKPHGFQTPIRVDT